MLLVFILSINFLTSRLARAIKMPNDYKVEKKKKKKERTQQPHCFASLPGIWMRKLKNLISSSIGKSLMQLGVVKIKRRGVVCARVCCFCCFFFILLNEISWKRWRGSHSAHYHTNDLVSCDPSKIVDVVCPHCHYEIHRGIRVHIKSRTRNLEPGEEITSERMRSGVIILIISYVRWLIKLRYAVRGCDSWKRCIASRL